jgi:hypothetical protein
MISAIATKTTQPTERALRLAALGQKNKSFRAARTADHFEVKAKHALGPLLAIPAIETITVIFIVGLNDLQSRMFGLLQLRQDQRSGFGIIQRRAHRLQSPRQPQCFDDQMTLSAGEIPIGFLLEANHQTQLPDR